MEPTGESRTDGEIFRGVAEALGTKLISSEQEFRWEMQHLLERITGQLLQGVPAHVMAASAATGESAEAGADENDSALRFGTVNRLYGGGGTARFDRMVQLRAAGR